MNNFNIINSFNHIEKIINRLQIFVNEECDKNIKEMTLEDIEGLKEGYTQLLWIEENINESLKKIKKTKIKYDKKINNIVHKLEYVKVNSEECKHYPIYNIFLPNTDIYYKLCHLNETHSNINNLQNQIEQPNNNLFNSINKLTWGDEQEYVSVIHDIVSLKINGYPDGIENLEPIKNIMNNTFRHCVGIIAVDDINKKMSKITPQLINIDENIIGEYMYTCGGVDIKIPVINSLDNIPKCMYYYYGDENSRESEFSNKYERGIYMKISDKVIVKIPFIDVIPDNIEFSKKKISKCHNGKECSYWKCMYAHNGVPYNKIGYKNRCPSNPGFSNKDTLNSDIKKVAYEDIRMCLMYSMSDLFSIFAWCQKYEDKIDKDIIITNLEICDDYENPFKLTI